MTSPNRCGIELNPPADMRDPHADRLALTILRQGALNPRACDEITSNPYLATLLGLLPDLRYAPAQMRQIVDDRLAALVRAKSGRERPLHRNIAMLATELSFTPAETEVLRFALLAHTAPVVEFALDVAQQRRGTTDLYGFIARVCGIPVDAAKAALSRRGALHTSGLVQLDAHMRADSDVKSRLDVMQRFGIMLANEAFSAEDLLSQCAAIAPASELTSRDYAHLKDDVKFVRELLRGALQAKTPGVNLLLWGPPGTGKSEFARMIAKLVGCTVREIISEDSEGDPMQILQRGQVFAIAQRLLGKRARTVLVFDEMEDLMGDHSPFMMRKARLGKAWMNRTLETNPVPTVWISNDADDFDPAVLRRFSYVLKFDAPPRKARTRIIERQLSGLEVDAKLVDELARVKRLPPSAIAQAVKVARLLPKGSAITPTEAIRKVISGTTDIMDLQIPKEVPVASVALPYDLAYTNADIDLASLTTEIKAVGSARLCLYGAPGTGKTEYGRVLARRLDRPLVVRRGSDLLGKYVGQTERNIAEAFDEALRKRAVLLIDEADSFVFSRQGVGRSWERSMVNEFLTQMERFEGVLVCSTNLPEALDDAAARRFDLQVKFGTLRTEQAWGLFRAVLKQRGIGIPRGRAATEVRARLDALADLTPGDYAKAARAGRLMGDIKQPADLVATLERVIASKSAGHMRRTIGFVQ